MSNTTYGGIPIIDNGSYDVYRIDAVTVTILSLTGTQEIVVDATVLAAETVILGNVPSTYIGLGGPEEEGT